MASISKPGILSRSRADRDQGNRRREQSHNDGRSTAKVVGYTTVLTVMISIAVFSYGSLPQPNLATSGTKFSVANSRKHLTAITSLGIHTAGSVKNDIEARDTILKTLSEIKEMAADEVEIEVSLQNPSGSFYLDFLGGLTHIYKNLTNIVVRFNQHINQPVKHALLVNCHFDSAIGSPAASDDASSCAILIEVLRCLSVTPILLDHAVIFLFNGAEEMVLPASHGFITQHPWAKDIRAFINLEAAGAGGKELVFQTGPSNPWLAKAYARSAIYPYGAVVGEEIFQSGIIPSDTDFRIFRDFGNIPGIDMAYFINGYVYHTEYDLPELIPDGSIQRAGENILSMIKEIANSPYLANPGEDKHGRVIYFDLIGFFMVVYPMRIGVILNYSVAVLVLVSLWRSGRRRRRGEGGYLLILKTSGVLLLSEAAALSAGLLTALLTTISGHTLSYYSKPHLVIPLFYVPSVLAMGAVHYWWRRKHPHLPADSLDYITTLSSHFLWLPLLILTTYLRLCSSFVPVLFIIFPFFFWTILWHSLLNPLSNGSFPVSFLCFSASLLFILPGTALVQVMNDFFVPLVGRSGSELPPDVAVGVMSSVLICLLGLNLVPTLVHYSKQWLLKLILFVGTLFWVLCLSAVLLGLVFPYSAQDPIAPKRLFLQQATVTFHHSGNHSYSGMFFLPMDNRGMQPIIDSSSYFRDNLKRKECKGIYCGVPHYLPLAHVLKGQWYMESAPPTIVPAHLHLESVVKTSEDTRNFTFVVKFPNLGRIYIDPVAGMSLVSWSLDHFIPSPTPYGDEGRGCYYIMFLRGAEDRDERFKFWIEIKGDVSVSPSVELAAMAMYLDPPLSDTPQLREVKSKLPDWVTTVSLTSTLDSWMF